MTAWASVARFFAGEPLGAARWVVVDCETSGLDPATDRLLAIGAVVVARLRISPQEVFETTLAQAQPSARDNILIHRIGEARQRSGQAPAAALAAFMKFAGNSPCAAFHAPFDRAVISRAARQADLPVPRRWLDLAQLLPVLFPDRKLANAPLDDWLAAFAIRHRTRHDALGDALATAQLLQIALSAAERQGFASVASVMSAAGASRWIGR